MDTDVKIILLDYQNMQNTQADCLKHQIFCSIVSNIWVNNISYYDSPTKLFSDLYIYIYLFLDILAKSFLSV